MRRIDPERSQRLCRDTLGFAIYRQFGGPDTPGTVFFLGNGSLKARHAGDRAF